MKRLLSTLILCLMASTAALLAQQRYSLTLKTSPQGMSEYTIMAQDSYGFTYKNGSAYQIIPGDRVQVYMNHLVTGWKVREWRATEGNAELELSGNKENVYFTMPAENLTLTAILEYDPDNPDNPMPNGWYPDDGKLVIDYLNEVAFSTLVSRLVPEEDYELVNTVIVGGRLGSYGSDISYWLSAERFPSLRRVDLSRVDYGGTMSFSAQDRPWEELLLPACVKSFGREAFKGTFLNELTLYATTPPTLTMRNVYDASGRNVIGQEQNVFPSTDFTVYVPEESLPLYQADEGWKVFELKPIIKDAANISVSVQPTGGDMSPYYGMTLEIRDVKSLATRSMIIGNRKDYRFMTLPKHTAYDVRLLSRTGSVVAQASSVLLDEEDVSVTLTGLRRPCTLQLAVSAGTAAVAADKYECLWVNNEGRILMRGHDIDGILEDEQVKAIITLTDSEIKATYRERDTISVTPSTTLSTINYQLKPIPTHQLTTVVQRADGQFFGRQTATVTINRTGNGELVRQLTFSQLTSSGGLTSGQQEPLPEGEYDVTASVDISNMTTVTQHLSLYGDQTLTFQLAEAKGSTVNLKWTHYGVAAEGTTATGSEKPITEAAITLRDLTNGRNLTDFAVTPTGSLRLQELLEPGTEVELTLGNRGGSQFAPAVLRAKADSEGNLSYDVVTRDYGTLRVSFTATECSRVSVRIYDAQGQLVNAGNAVSTVKEFSLLKDGNYNVVLMEGSAMANAMTTFSDIDKFLQQDVDYVSKQVSIRSGETATAAFETVPALSSSAHLYTDDASTRVTPKKSSVTIGTYQTLSTQVLFRPEYKGRISQLKAVFTLPDSVNFIDGSPIIDNAQTAYTRDGQQITVPIVEKHLLRFCVVPHDAGECGVNARITFLLDGTPCEQPLPVTTFMANEAGIHVVNFTASEQVNVSGTALPSVPVTIYVNDQKAGTTTSNVYGEWTMDVTLTATNNMDENTVYAQFEGTDGYTLKSATKTVVYDLYSIRPISVRMSHYNTYAKSEYVVNFDLRNNTCSPPAYSFFREAEFTFDVTLNTPDSTYIDNVLLYVYMTGNQRRILFPKYNAQTGTWVATDVFDATGLPTQVNVVVEDHAPTIVSDKSISDKIHYYDDIEEKMKSEDPELTAIFDQANNSPEGSKEEQEAMRQLMIHTGVDPDVVMNTETLPNTPEAKAQWEADMDAALAAFDATDAEYAKLDAEGYFSFDATPLNELGQILGGYNFSKLSSSARQYYEARARGEHPEMAAAGPNEEEYVLDLESGEKVYYRVHDDGYTIVIPHEDLQITCDYSAMDPEVAAAVRELRHDMATLSRLVQQAPYRASEPGFVREVAAITKKILEWIDKINGYVSEIESAVQVYVNGAKKAIDANVDKIHDATMKAWDKFYACNERWGYGLRLKNMKLKATNACNQLENLRLGKIKLDKLSATWSKIGKVSKFLSIISLVSDYQAFVECFETLEKLYYSVPDPCKLEQDKADALRRSIDNWATARLVQKGIAIVNDAASVASALAGILATVTTAGTGVIFGGIGVGASFAISTANWIGNMASDYIWEKKVNSFRKQIDELKCDTVPCPKSLKFDMNKELAEGDTGSSSGSGGSAKSGGCGGGDDCQKGRNTRDSSSNGGCPGPPPPPPPGTTPILDPSGYVYEAVASNRVADALASVFYKELYEDMYGDTHERTVLWDAEKFDQVNPMLTDENGEYGWDVPSGLWQVRVVKDGYLTTESEWLPVPPPQLDVNLAMQQPTAPVVQRVTATEQGVDLRFDKYMKPAHLTSENIFFTKGGQKLDGTLRLMDAEPTPDSTKTFARRVLFQPSQPLKLNDKVRLTVKAGIESYADVGLLNDFTQEFDVEQHISELVADSVVGILHGDDYTITVSTLPAAVAKGKKVNVKSLNPDIASIAATELTLDQNGQATLTIKGKGYGTTAVRFTLADDKEIQTLTVVGVKDADGLLTKRPTASRISGTEVLYGSPVSLRCETPGAVIYYTLDGSCPCDNPNRLRYNSPIVITRDMTLKAIAVAPGYAESDVVSFNYRVKRDPQSITTAEATRNNKSVYTLQGIMMKEGSQLKRGVYLVGKKKIVVK